MHAPLTGRITASPDHLLHTEILAPQFEFEVEHLLPCYLAIEKVLALEYLRLGLIDESQAKAIGAALHEITAATLTADPAANLSDLAFALERQVESTLPAPVPRWHVDRSRNDLQATAQVMFGREELARTARSVLDLARAAHHLATDSTEIYLPGYTHAQAAQVITPGFYFAAVSEELLGCARRLLATYGDIDRCPLGGGAMAGQELDWDRDRSARLLGFCGPRRHALSAVASRDWVLKITGELSLLGVTLSRFATDLITWSSSEYGFIDLPDEYAGISSAMPQKKNFPLLERIRGRTAHLTAFHLDALTAQRNTAYSNSVEVSKEAGTHLLAAFTAARSTLALATAVLENLTFRTDRMLEVCQREYFGGFTLANLLALGESVPWRKAQVIAGTYILEAIKQGSGPLDLRPDLLRQAAEAHGFELADPEHALAEAFDVSAIVQRKVSPGSTQPAQVRSLLEDQQKEHEQLATAWAERDERVAAALARVDSLLALTPAPGHRGAGNDHDGRG